MAALEATRESRWCSLEETIVAAALADDGKRGWCWDVGADDQLMPFVAEELRKRALWGASGSSQNAPDQLMLHSGGPVTDVASSTLLAGPPMLRFLAKQPQVPLVCGTSKSLPTR